MVRVGECGARIPLAVLAVWIAATAGAAKPPTTAESILANQPPGLVERLYANKSVVLQEVGDDNLPAAGFVHALVIFEQPRNRVMRLLSQTTRHIEFRPELSAIEAIEWLDSGVVDEHRLRIMFVNVTYRLHNQWDFEAVRITWRLDPSFENRVRRLEGYWEFYELERDRTLGRFGTLVDVGPAMPGFLQDLITRKNVPRAIERARRWVDSDGRYRP